MIEARVLKDCEVNDTLAYHTWPGAYKLHYICKDGGVLCPECANEPVVYNTGEEEEEWHVVDYQVHWEGPPLVCAHCGAKIKSEY